uniref:4-coumarate--CoA ligase 1 n=1 Tax=Culex pipiens TaxID=7175 RepID=A0A8D8BQ18_CULPI
MTSYDPERLVWSGPRVAPLFDPGRSLGDILFELLDRNPDQVLQIDGDTDRRITRGELKLRAIRIAQHLTIGGQVNDIVTIAALNSGSLASLVVALQFLAVPYNAVFPNFTHGEMVGIMAQTQSRVIFCDAWNYEAVRNAAREAVQGEFKIFLVDGEVDGVATVDDLLVETGTEQDFSPKIVADTSKAIYSIFCSSGTTGPPKGICLSHANKTSSFLPAPYNNPTVLAMGSIHWLSTAYMLDLVMFYDGTVVTTKQPFSEDLFFDLIERYRIDLLNGPPIQAYAITHHPRVKQVDLSNVKLWSIGGYNVSDAIRDSVDAILPNGKSYTIYASTESGLIAADMAKRKRGAIGTLFPNVQVRIVDDDGQFLPVGQPGELWIKRYVAFPGYLNNEQATREVQDDEGWFRSGDVGYFDEEGYLFLVDRKSEIFKYVTQVSPTELEDIIAELDGVAEVCVVGIPTLDQSAELPTAVVVRREGSALRGEEVVKFVEGRVMDHKRLRGGVFFVESLAKTSKGSLKRKEVRRLIMEELNVKV